MLFRSGILPDSPFYGLKLIIERLQILFTFNQDAKTEKLIEFAERRLAELEALSEEQQAKYAERLVTAFAKALEEAENLGGQAVTDAVYKTKPQKVTEAVYQSVYRQSYITLQRVYEKVPDQAKPAIQRAMERAQTGKLRREAVTEAKETGEKPSPNLNAPGQVKKQQTLDNEPAKKAAPHLNAPGLLKKLEPVQATVEETEITVQELSNNRRPEPAAPQAHGRDR